VRSRFDLLFRGINPSQILALQTFTYPHRTQDIDQTMPGIMPDQLSFVRFSTG
jgi:hypothetical protein